MLNALKIICFPCNKEMKFVKRLKNSYYFNCNDCLQTIRIQNVSIVCRLKTKIIKVYNFVWENINGFFH